PAMHPFDEIAHPVEIRSHFGHDIMPIYEYRTIRAVAQGSVQNRAMLCGVNFLAGEHRGDALAQAARPRERHQQGERLARHSLTRAVKQQVPLDEGDFRESIRVACEQIPRMNVPEFRRVLLQSTPFRRLNKLHRALPTRKSLDGTGSVLHSIALAGMGADGARLPREGQIEPLTEATHPADLTRGHADHQ